MARDSFEEYFRRMMKRVFKDFEEFEKGFELPWAPAEKEKPGEFIIKKPGGGEKRSGFSIFISSDGESPPKVELKRFGPRGWEKAPPHNGKITPAPRHPKRKLELKTPAELIKNAPPKVKEKAIPEYNVSIDIKEVTITLNAPGVEREGNVRVKFYPESVEVYTAAPRFDKGHFCTVAIPASVDEQGTEINVEKDRATVKIPQKLSVT